MNNQRLFLFAGPPGCGKGTQGKKLVDHFGVDGCFYFEMGRYIRDKRKTEASFNELCLRHNMDNGGFLPLSELEGAVETQIDGFVRSDAEFLILDGYPRTVEQLESLSSLLKGKYKDLKVFYFHFELDKEECVQRIMDRSSSSCRDDDNEKVARERYEKYKEMTLPMINKLDTVFGVGSGRIISPNSIENIFDYIIFIIKYLNEKDSLWTTDHSCDFDFDYGFE